MENTFSEFEQLGCKVILLANGTKESGIIWRKANPSQFPAYCDPEWNVYRQLGLRRILGFRVTAMLGYAERKMQGIPLPQIYEGDDPFIMGGDFIVRKDGEIIYAFHQNTPQRPSVEDLLSYLKARPNSNP